MTSKLSKDLKTLKEIGEALIGSHIVPPGKGIHYPNCPDLCSVQQAEWTMHPDNTAKTLATLVRVAQVMAYDGQHKHGCHGIDRPHMHRGVDCDERHECDCGFWDNRPQHAIAAIRELAVAVAN